MPLEIKELHIKVVVNDESATTATGGDEMFRTQFGNNDAPGAGPTGTGKTLTASLLGQSGAADGGEDARLVAEGGQPEEGICHGVTVLAWARVDGTASSTDPASREASDAGRIEIDSFSWDRTTVHDGPYEATFMGGVTVAASEVGSGDDVVVDGRIITGDGFEAGFGDGSVRFITANVDPF